MHECSSEWHTYAQKHGVTAETNRQLHGKKTHKWKYHTDQLMKTILADLALSRGAHRRFRLIHVAMQELKVRQPSLHWIRGLAVAKGIFDDGVFNLCRFLVGKTGMH